MQILLLFTTGKSVIVCSLNSSEYTHVYILYFMCYVNVAQISQNWLQRTSFNIIFNETRWQTLDCCGKENKSHEKCLSDIFCVKFNPTIFWQSPQMMLLVYQLFWVIFLPLIPEISTVLCFSIVFQYTIDLWQNMHKFISKMWKKTYM